MLTVICRRTRQIIAPTRIPLSPTYTASLDSHRFYNPAFLMASSVSKQSDRLRVHSGLIDQALMSTVMSETITGLINCFSRNGFSARVAGGAVRDLVLGVLPHDIDLATDATPEVMQAFLERSGYRTEPTGLKHGTIMVVIEGVAPIEITTLRVDKVTDGRHAEVQFTHDWECDAARRDFTINAMFMDEKGEVMDYFNGLEDLRERRLRFVNDPVARIREDYLRILRYFRFYGRISSLPHTHEQHTLTAIRENAGGLENISVERIWKELQQILTGDHCPYLLRLMYELGLALPLRLPVPGNLQELERVWTLHSKIKSSGYKLTAETLFISLLEGGSEHSVGELCSRWKMSNKQKKLAIVIANQRTLYGKLDIPNYDYTKHCKDLIVDGSPTSHVLEVMLYLERSMEEVTLLENWECPVFPVTGHDLLKLNLTGKQLAVVKEKLRQVWKESYYCTSKEELLSKVSE